MKIKKVFIRKLFNKNFEILFNDDITFLYGKNGCGKTTILNIISAIISARLNELNTYDFEFLELVCENYQAEIKTVTVEKAAIIAGSAYKVTFGEVSCIIPLPDSYLRTRSSDEVMFLEEFEESEDRVKREEAATTVELANFTSLITKQFKPIYLPLSRKDSGITDRPFARRKPEFKEKNSLDSSVRHALELVKEFNALVTQLDNTILEQLKEEIVTKALNTLELTPSNLLSYDKYLAEVEQYLSETKNEENDNITGFSLPLEKELNELSNKIYSLSSSFTIKNSDQIDIKSPLEFANYVSSISQLRRVIEIITMIKKANVTRRNRRLPITKLIRVINLFLQDGDKEIFIEQKTRSLRFRTVGVQESNSILAMSSGEKQIVIFFVYVLLGLSQSEKSGTFIIDEPELSLHVEWQNKFVPSIMDVAQNNQLIFATHSPEIIGEMTYKCIEVRGVPVV